MLCQRFVRRTDDLVYIFQLLQPVGTPAHNAGRGKDGRVEGRRQPQHTVHKSAVEIHIGVNTLIDPSLLSDHLRSHVLYCIIERILLLISILVQKIVINGIYKVNRSLRKITDGNLNIEIKVDSTQEFRNLSQGINSMVSSLKNAIEQANTRIDSELEFAQSIQLSSLPQNTNSYSASAYNEFDLYALMKTAKKVGGDFYYYFFKDKTHLCFFIGDVSGKGIPAALFMMTIPPLIRSYSETGYGAADIFNHVNRNLCKNSSSNMFVTIFLAILDTQTGELTYVNAGHNPPLLRKNNSQFEYMKIKPGLVLAALENMHYTEAKIFLESGDIIFLYTDGVTEAMNSKGELFSENRLKNSLNKMSFNISSKEIIQEMLIEIDKFTTNTNQTDDITMLALKYNGLSK